MVAKVAGAAVHAAAEVGKAQPTQSFSRALQHVRPAPAPAPKPEPKPEPTRVVREIADAQAKLDQLLKLAESGRSFSPAELLAFQTHAYRASQEIDLASKVVDKATSGVKQTLNTQV
jgi:hypothetical protein